MKKITKEKTKYHGEVLANRVVKNYKHLKRRFNRANIDCFRLYDWDIPEVRAIVDWYAGHIVVYEYVREQTGPDWLPVVARAAGEALGIPADHIHYKERRTHNRQGMRYKKLNSKNQRFVVNERDLKFWVNLDDYLDTGLYSDHRDTRVFVRDLVKGKAFLNLFAYTGAFTCIAAAGCAKATTTVDRSATYQRWTRDNLQLNNLWNATHTLVQSDVDKFLAQAQKRNQKYSFVFVDPPSFFKQQSAGRSFDMNRDHVQLLNNVLNVVEPGGTVLFSTNHQRFTPQLHQLKVKDLKELTSGTIPDDYRNKKAHRCWMMKAF